MSARRLFLSAVPAGIRQRRLAQAVALISLIIFLAAAPFATLQLPTVWAFLPIYQSSLVIGDLITATLLFAQAGLLRSRPLLFLAGGYLFGGLMAIAHALSFPGLFSETGLLGGGQTTAWLYFLWHGGFPLFVIAYALWKDDLAAAGQITGRPGLAIAASCGATVLLACGMAMLARSDGLLPDLMLGSLDGSRKFWVATATWMLSLLALPFLWRRRPHTVLDTWLMVVMCAFIFDTAMAAVLNHGRFDLGWYAGRVYGLIAASFVLVVLLLETGGLYARLIEAERRQRNAALQALRDSLARNDALFSSALVGILMVSESGKVESINPAAERLFNANGSKIDGADVASLIDLRAAEGQDSPARLLELIEDGQDLAEFEARTEEGSVVPIDLLVTEMPLGSQRTFILFVRDITEKKRVERLKNEFVATVSHELRTPVTSMVGALSLLAAKFGGQLPSSAGEMLALANRNGQRLTRLLSEILDIERMESGRPVFALQRVELAPALRKAMEANREDTERFKVHLRLEDAAEGALVRADSERLAQAIGNLISNAIKFSPLEQEVVVSTEARDGYVRIAVRDHGPGIPDSFGSSIFDKFVQVEATDARQKGGVGLGLTIVRQIMEGIGGKVGYENLAGGGAIFHLDVPTWDAGEDAGKVVALPHGKLAAVA